MISKYQVIPVPEYVLKKPNIPRSIYVPEELDKELKKIAAEKGTDKSSLYRIGSEILLAIIDYGDIPECILELLIKQERDDLLESLRGIVGGVRIEG